MLTNNEGDGNKCVSGCKPQRSKQRRHRHQQSNSENDSEEYQLETEYKLTLMHHHFIGPCDTHMTWLQ